MNTRNLRAPGNRQQGRRKSATTGYNKSLPVIIFASLAAILAGTGLYLNTVNNRLRAARQVSAAKITETRPSAPVETPESGPAPGTQQPGQPTRPVDRPPPVEPPRQVEPPRSVVQPRPSQPERPQPVAPPSDAEGIWRAKIAGNGIEQTFVWDVDDNWIQSGFPSGAGSEAIIELGLEGIETFNIQLGRDIVLGILHTLEARNTSFIWQRGHLLTFDNGDANAQWHRYRTENHGRSLRLLVFTDIRLNSTLEATWTVQRAIELDNKITGPGGLIIHHTSTDSTYNNRRIIMRGDPNTYEGNTTINGLAGSDRRTIVLVEKNGAFGTGNLTVNEFVELVLTYRGTTNDMIDDRAALRLIQSSRGQALVTINQDVEETVGALFFNNERQAAGTWGSSASNAQHKNDDFFAGPGVLRVVN